MEPVMFTMPGEPFLYDAAGDPVGIRRRDGTAFMFPTQAQLDKLTSISDVGAVTNPTLLPDNSTITFSAPTDQVVASTTPSAYVFPDGNTYHFNIKKNAAGEVLSISAWGLGESGLVGGY